MEHTRSIAQFVVGTRYLISRSDGDGCPRSFLDAIGVATGWEPRRAGQSRVRSRAEQRWKRRRLWTGLPLSLPSGSRHGVSRACARF